MENKNMTALVSCFARAYHSKNYKYKIFDDYLAGKILSESEYDSISSNMQKGITFFNPNFKGSDSEALRWIVDNQLSPSVLARGAFAEQTLKAEIKLGVRQYLIFASGYDTSAYRLNSNITKYEIDREEMINDKIARLDRTNINHQSINYIGCDFINKNWINTIINSSYNQNEKTFCSLLGISYYLSKEEFETMIHNISKILCDGSSIVFDYPTFDETEKEIINQKLAAGANEEMKSKYSYQDIGSIASKNDLFIYKNLNHQDIDNEYFYNYNTLNPNNKIYAPRGVNYCLMVKKTVH